MTFGSYWGLWNQPQPFLFDRNFLSQKKMNQEWRETDAGDL